MHQRITFQHNWAMHGWVIDDSAHFKAAPNVRIDLGSVERTIPNF